MDGAGRHVRWDSITAHRACRDVRGVGSQRRLGQPGLGLEHRSSSLSRCPQGRLPTQAWPTRAGAQVGSQRTLRRSRHARPAGGCAPCAGLANRGWDSNTAHRACRDVRRVGSQRRLGQPALGLRSAPSARCGGLDTLDQRVVAPPAQAWPTGAGTRTPLIELVEMSAGSAPRPRCGGDDVPARVTAARTPRGRPGAPRPRRRRAGRAGRGRCGCRVRRAAGGRPWRWWRRSWRPPSPRRSRAAAG